ncbi:hypothetical protein HYH02_011546 [Chlamydomonas schloesseri]|uniref:Damage-control phosphatase ARMT1-like metal-binding domain-containing protein n=1 Tax=Chlamydomonas schloesseri TaxID=2026947 RepID=A0A835TE89_9CHLO|nr:hypothetical protein HYH02_011546 [Chlamydomonas schloesseri]|eukprot:KAG2436611.1 hypothetical protein HYH02_011546 [Chlamydomonas schloesseri]
MPASLAALLPGYACNTFDYATRAPAGDGLPTYREWIEVFRNSIPTFRSHALTDTTVPDDKRQAAAERFAADFHAALDALLANPTQPAPGYPASQPLNCFNLCKLREDVLHAAGFTDIFAEVKAAESARALALLPGVCAELDSHGGLAEQFGLALRGVFAGNIFDLGAAASAELHAAGGISFAATRDKLLPRPWAVDDYDQVLALVAAAERRAGASSSVSHPASSAAPAPAFTPLAHGPLLWRKAALFVDNAGPDVVLGMMPLARLLVKMGAEVLLMANRGATINDITAAELAPMLVAAAAAEPAGPLGWAVGTGRLRVVSSGSDMPVIDLSQLSEEAVAATADCDLIVLEGMGRAIETNLNCQMRCDSLKLGMIKHPEVAALLGGRLYDCVCRYHPGAEASAGAAALAAAAAVAVPVAAEAV